ncbi:hypothetical protein A3A40_00585 [Candidatus Kaiserbacteria bacterium RIFCSPLOWO2_01_FULL_54_20]|uniref:Uncharacterized protein n=1 Tax=Candidatus Kaiserbacteria bacterium RIFCSPLOWO2_01_FULL_54_20 TaxID=1798513 RepID=A0A1F6EK36_9BACT|nr:MAG: hypothetical protein A3A40_00585 [Candidatus Kaiserbacteria bacterium RIFCSPLOWO2_01_FULL_54_20]
MNESKKHLFIIYELEHLPVLEKRLAAGEKFEVVALDWEIELELKNRGIPHVPLRQVAKSPEGERGPVEFTRKLARTWYRKKEFAFFAHDGILLGEPYEMPFLYYFQMLYYHLSVIGQVLERLRPSRVVIPESFRYVPKTALPTEAPFVQIPFAVARHLAQMCGLECEVIEVPATYRHRGERQAIVRGIKERLVRAVTVVVNAAVSLRRPRAIRLFATDPWSRIAPFVRAMPDLEVVMSRRREIWSMKGDVWRSRARFHHRLDFADARERTIAHEKTREFIRAFEALGERPEVAKAFVYNGISLWKVAREALKAVIASGEDMVHTIESTKRLFSRRRINCVLLFTSVKGYNNIIARVAEQAGIPCIDLQHALAPMDLNHPYSRLSAHYLASYGPHMAKQYETFGVDASRIIPIGSPRFDAYATPLPEVEQAALRKKLGLHSSAPTALLGIPFLFPQLDYYGFTSYTARDIIEDLAFLARENKNVQYLLRPKPGKDRYSFYNRKETLDLFGPDAHMAQFDNLRALIELSTIVVSMNSTLLLETLILHRPVILYLPLTLDHDFDAWETAGALRIARDRTDLMRHFQELSSLEVRQKQVRRADEFMKEQFCFDGQSKDRMTAFLRKIVAERQRR